MTEDAAGDADPQMWEHQGAPLTVEWLLRALVRLPLDMIVEVGVYDGSGLSRYEPVDITVGDDGGAPRLIVSATRLAVDI